MIFRPLKISELERDLKEKEEAFRASREDLKAAAKHKFSPSRLLKNHKSILGIGVGSLSLLTGLYSLRKWFGFGKEEPKDLAGKDLKGGRMMELTFWGIKKVLSLSLPFAFLFLKDTLLNRRPTSKSKPE